MSSEFVKSAEISIERSVSDAEIAKINQYTLEPLKADEVFVFKLMAGDNGTDDRNCEPFSARALMEMAPMYKGKPVIWEHGYGPKGSEQIARIYDAEVTQTDKVLDDGSKETQLILHAYMLDNDANKNLIDEIKAGIKKEVSTNCRPKSLICSVCGQDQMVSYCRHWAGRTYEGKQCLMTIDSVKDVLEISFVGTPAQPRAGAIKAYNPALKDVKESDFEEENSNISLEAPDHLKVAEMELFLMAERAKEIE